MQAAKFKGSFMTLVIKDPLNFGVLKVSKCSHKRPTFTTVNVGLFHKHLDILSETEN